ncbi:MAG TPA: GFA family protein [Micropepsaceae bacterium]|jgi:hypothetical protein|nr:GFA family protein [Micropepsaceae bacterium]
MAVHIGSCHCGAVEFEIHSDLTSVLICDCSLCKRKNAIMTRVPKEEFRLLKGEGDLALYQWNTKIAKHYFCKHCGIYTHHQPRTAPDMIGVNLGCIDTIDARALPVQKAEGSKLSGGR